MTPAAREILIYCHGYYRIEPWREERKRLPQAGQVAYYVFRNIYPNASLGQIARAFDKEGHETIKSGIDRVESNYELLADAKHIVKLFQK